MSDGFKGWSDGQWKTASAEMPDFASTIPGAQRLQMAWRNAHPGEQPAECDRNTPWFETLADSLGGIWQT